MYLPELKTHIYGTALDHKSIIGDLEPTAREYPWKNLFLPQNIKGGLQILPDYNNEGQTRFTTSQFPSPSGRHELWLPEEPRFGVLAVLYPNPDVGLEEPVIDLLSLEDRKIESRFITSGLYSFQEDNAKDYNLGIFWGKLPLIGSIKSFYQQLAYQIRLNYSGKVTVSPTLFQPIHRSQRKGIATAGINPLR